MDRQGRKMGLYRIYRAGKPVNTGYGVDMKWCSEVLMFSPIRYGLCKSEDDYHKTLKKLGMPTAEMGHFLQSDATTNIFMINNQLHAFVCMGSTKGMTKEQVSALICHEAVHVFQAICKELGEDSPSSEFQAYAIQGITQNLLIDMNAKE